jgi:hypothetical protein
MNREPVHGKSTWAVGLGSHSELSTPHAWLNA